MVYNSRIVAEKMKTIDFILDGKFHLHTPKKEGFRTKSKVALKKKGALFGHSSFSTDPSLTDAEWGRWAGISLNQTVHARPALLPPLCELDATIA